MEHIQIKINRYTYIIKQHHVHIHIGTYFQLLHLHPRKMLFLCFAGASEISTESLRKFYSNLMTLWMSSRRQEFDDRSSDIFLRFLQDCIILFSVYFLPGWYMSETGSGALKLFLLFFKTILNYFLKLIVSVCLPQERHLKKTPTHGPPMREIAEHLASGLPWAPCYESPTTRKLPEDFQGLGSAATPKGKTWWLLYFFGGVICLVI